MTEPSDQSVPDPGESRTASPLDALRAAWPDVHYSVFEPRVGPGQHIAEIATTDLVDFAGAALSAGFELFVDLCAVDYLRRDPRFEVVITLLSMDPAERLRIKVAVTAGEPVVPSITGVYPGANFYEREAFDLFGIRFEGHPDLSRILLPDEWEGHPLRKDYGVGSVPVQFKEAHKAT